MRSLSSLSGRVALVVTVALSAVACGGDDPPGDEREDVAAHDRAARDEAAEDKDSATESGKSPRGRSGARRQDSRKTSRDGGDDAGSGEEAAEDDGSSRYAPSPGLYVYAQEGSERFCDASGCERQDLPARQKVKTYYEGAQGDALMVVTEARTSDSRFVRTSSLHSQERALVTKVHVRVDYEGFEFKNTYQPDPPVEALRFPLKAGQSWAGSWNDSTSGDYEVTVGAAESVEVSGSIVRAHPVRTETTFRGELKGRAEVTTWIDPATAAVVRSQGKVSLESVFGRYESTFSTVLRDGPDYR